MNKAEELRQEILNGKLISRKKFEKMLQEYCPGATYKVEWSGRLLIGDVDSPKGFVFGGSLTHCIKAAWYSGNIPEMFRELASDLVYGLEECDDPECEICHDEE
jgi:hypothetical protein